MLPRPTPIPSMTSVLFFKVTPKASFRLTSSFLAFSGLAEVFGRAMESTMNSSVTTPITMNGARQPMLCARMPATAVPAASPTDMEELYSPITEPQRDFLVQLVSMDTDTGA